MTALKSMLEARSYGKGTLLMALDNLVRVAAFAMMVAFTACARAEMAPPAVAQADGLYREEVVVETQTGPVRFWAEIADEPAEQERGLMFRRELAREHGMLFQFPRPAPQAFWMHNTPLSLDIIFIGPDGRILNIAEHATPFSQDPIPSRGPAIAVLEINAGLSRELGIAPGDRVRHPFLRGD